MYSQISYSCANSSNTSALVERDFFFLVFNSNLSKRTSATCFGELMLNGSPAS